MGMITTPRTKLEASGLKRALTEIVSINQSVDDTGIVEDFTGSSFRVTADGSSTTVTVGQVGNQLKIRGHATQITSTELLNLASFGTQPTAGQQRLDLIVARLRKAAPYEIFCTVVPGTPASPGLAVAPQGVRDSDFWDFELAVATRSGTAAVAQSAIADRRLWVGRDYMFSGPRPDAARFAIGSVLHSVRESWARTVFDDGSGSPGWTLIRESSKPRLVMHTDRDVAMPAASWVPLPFEERLGNRGPLCFELNTGPLGRGLTCQVAGDYNITAVGSFSVPHVAMRIDVNGDCLIMETDPAPTARGRTAGISFTDLPMTVGQRLDILGYCADPYVAFKDSGSALPPLPFKLFVTLRDRA